MNVNVGMVDEGGVGCVGGGWLLKVVVVVVLEVGGSSVGRGVVHVAAASPGLPL